MDLVAMLPFERARILLRHLYHHINAASSAKR